jgi:hypothetical protein
MIPAAETGTAAIPAYPTDGMATAENISRAFDLERDPQTGFITALRRPDDGRPVEFLRQGSALGNISVTYRMNNGTWRKTESNTDAIALTSTFQEQKAQLTWDISLENLDARPLEIGDLALPLPMNTDYDWDPEVTFEGRVFRHCLIAGNGSFLYWPPVKGTGPILVMQPSPGTSLEFFTATGMDYAFGRENYTVYIHSMAYAEQAALGTWRQPRTSRVLQPGETAVYSFTFRWADRYEEVRELLFQQDGIDLHVAPGMVVPRDLNAVIALRTTQEIVNIEPEFPGETVIEDLGKKSGNTHLYRLKMRRLGENLVTIQGPDGWRMPLEFFVTEPLETLIKKRAAFIVRNQQHRDPSKWYNGLYSLWDRRQPEGQNLLGPDHLAGQYPYAVSGSDDPSNSKCLLVVEKNVAYPNAEEIESLEYFIRNFVWGKHQRTDQEFPYPYGIYGADSWKQNRFSERDPLDEGISRPGGPSACRMWRTFDYTTYFALYFNMYQIARQRPDLVHDLDATGYLERAYGTARAYFRVPAAIRMEGGWSFTGWVYWQYTVGNFHEKYLIPLISALEAEGEQAKADELRAEWEKKVKYFIYDKPWPFASEMPIDSTAYESTYAAGRYAMERGLEPDTNLWFDRNEEKWFSHPVIDIGRHRTFLNRQHAANLACRGVLEANYWSLGSDFRGCGSASYTLSYMSQMGGWAVLDYGLRYDPAPAANLRLGYASMLSSWALMNTGDQASDYGYWTPGALHDGSMSWGFQPRQFGTEWNPATRDLPRGAWPVCGEADHGLVAGIEAACTVLFDDPIFGMLALGGEIKTTDNEIEVVPRDGVRQRFHAIMGDRRLHLSLERDGFAAGQSVKLSPDLDRISFVLESRVPQLHETLLMVEGLAPGQYRAKLGDTVHTFHAEAGTPYRLRIEVDPSSVVEFQLWKVQDATADGAKVQS